MKPTPDARRGKKKVSILTQEKIEYIDWKDINLLRRFVSDRAKIRARRVTGNSAQQQRDVAMAIKNAREMACFLTQIELQLNVEGVVEIDEIGKITDRLKMIAHREKTQNPHKSKMRPLLKLKK